MAAQFVVSVSYVVKVRQRADIAEARRAWRELQPKLNPAKLVFL